MAFPTVSHKKRKKKQPAHMTLSLWDWDSKEDKGKVVEGNLCLATFSCDVKFEKKMLMRPYRKIHKMSLKMWAMGNRENGLVRYFTEL